MNLTPFFIDCAVYITLATMLLLGLSFFNPRLMLHKYPPAIQAIVPPRTDAEKRKGKLLAVPLLAIMLIYPFVATYRSDVGTFWGLFLYAFGLVWAFNIWDWLVIDWLIVCTITPKRIIIPGTEGNPAYKDYATHFRGFLIGTVYSLVLGLIVAIVVYGTN